MNKPPIRTIAIVLAVVFAIGLPIWRELVDFGLTQSEFARQGDGTLRAAGYAFSIWSVIYLGLAIYAVWQALPSTPESPLLRAVGWPSAIGIGACGDWIFVSAMDWRWLSVVVILIAAGSTLFALWRAVPEGDSVSARDRRIVLWPLGLLGGWLTAASALNIVTVMTTEGLAGQPSAVAIAALSAVAVVALGMLARTRSIPYGLAVLWALAGVWVAERGDNPTAAWVAVGWGVVLILAGLYLARARRP